MRRSDRRRLEDALRRGFEQIDARLAARASGAGAADEERLRALAAAIDRAGRRRAGMPGFLDIMGGQARFIGAPCWAAHLAAPVAAVVAVRGGAWEGVAVAALAAMLALALLVAVTRSRATGMVELEAACAVNAQAVACARVAMLGAADALIMVATVALVAGDGGPWLLAAQVCAPYLAAVAAGLLAARRVASADATIAAACAGAGVFAVCVVLYVLHPAAYGTAAGAAWGAAALLAAACAGVEVRAWLRSAASGFTDARTGALAAQGF